ncbi:MFS transporter [Rhodococcus sp. IEGM 1354]|uniref:MFS transporter n=1 Tax=Rhodococcus sp. IEGM 1354 TaxID=3047088 RepID=UPI0024B6EEE6|nr:MFS transporter [Rhodococcus sp. IEGM 1354]MDI9930691.1 MFS transporter [Rhodococcus sp. IEGM 1354]
MWQQFERLVSMSIARHKTALCVLFLIPGVSISSWVTRTPAIRDGLGASTSQMGLVLFGLSLGAMVGILASGPLVSRFGTKPVIGTGVAFVVLSMLVIGLGSALSVLPLVMGGLAVFGLGMGASEVAMNIEGAEIEARTGRPFLMAMHGMFSLGTVIGAAAGVVFTSVDFSVALHLSIVSSVGLLALFSNLRAIPAGTGLSRVPTNEPSSIEAAPLWRDTRLLGIGFVVLALALAEGTANDWLPLIMVDEHGFDQSLGSMVYATFALSMTIGRFCGGFIVGILGRLKVLTASAMFAALGLALVSVLENQVAAGAAVVLWGLGASLGFPLAISLAGDSETNSAARVSFASTLGYIAFLVGPPALGFLGGAFSLRGALLVPMAVAIGAAFLIPVTQSRTREARVFSTH